MSSADVLIRSFMKVNDEMVSRTVNEISLDLGLDEVRFMPQTEACFDESKKNDAATVIRLKADSMLESTVLPKKLYSVLSVYPLTGKDCEGGKVFIKQMIGKKQSLFDDLLDKKIFVETSCAHTRIAEQMNSVGLHKIHIDNPIDSSINGMDKSDWNAHFSVGDWCAIARGPATDEQGFVHPYYLVVKASVPLIASQLTEMVEKLIEPPDFHTDRINFLTYGELAERPEFKEARRLAVRHCNTLAHKLVSTVFEGTDISIKKVARDISSGAEKRMMGVPCSTMIYGDIYHDKKEKLVEIYANCANPKTSSLPLFVAQGPLSGFRLYDDIHQSQLSASAVPETLASVSGKLPDNAATLSRVQKLHSHVNCYEQKTRNYINSCSYSNTDLVFSSKWPVTNLRSVAEVYFF